MNDYQLRGKIAHEEALAAAAAAEFLARTAHETEPPAHLRDP